MLAERKHRYAEPIFQVISGIAVKEGMLPISQKCLRGVFAAGCLCGFLGCDEMQQIAAPPVIETATRVEVVQPQRKDIRHTVTQPATVHPYHQADIVAKVAGYFEAVYVDIGDEVEEGQPLAKLSIPEMDKQRDQAVARQQRLAAELERATAAAEVAAAQRVAAKAEVEEALSNVEQVVARLIAERADLDRVQGLVQKQAATLAMLDDAQSAHDVSVATKVAAEAAVRSSEARLQIAIAEQKAAEAEIATARARLDESGKEVEEIDTMLDYATLRAPFAGVVTSRDVDPGDFVSGSLAGGESQRPLFHVDQQHRLRVRVTVPERDAADVDAGDPVVIDCDARPGKPIEAEVTRVARRLDPSTRTMVAEVDLDNHDTLLLPGMFGRATITARVQADALVLPASAVRMSSVGEPHVLVLDAESRVSRVPVVIGADDGREIEIVDGLTGNEQVVDAVVGTIESGQQVEVVRR